MVGVYTCANMPDLHIIFAVDIAVKFWHVMSLPGQISWLPNSRETSLSLDHCLSEGGTFMFAAAERGRQGAVQVRSGRQNSWR